MSPVIRVARLLIVLCVVSVSWASTNQSKASEIHFTKISFATQRSQIIVRTKTNVHTEGDEWVALLECVKVISGSESTPEPYIAYGKPDEVSITFDSKDESKFFLPALELKRANARGLTYEVRFNSMENAERYRVRMEKALIGLAQFEATGEISAKPRFRAVTRRRIGRKLTIDVYAQ